MSTRPTKPSSRPRPTAEDREDLALIRRRMRDVAEGRDRLVPLDEFKRELAKLDEREDEAATAERDRKRRRAVPIRTRAAAPKVSGPRRRAAGGR